MLVYDVMTSPALSVHLAIPLKRVAQVLYEHSITALPVVDDDGRVIGVISEADIVLEALPSDSRAREEPTRMSVGPYLTRAGDVMNPHPVTVRSDTGLGEAAEILTSTTIKSLPVVDDGVLVGVVSRRDIVAVLARSDAAIAAELDAFVQELGLDWLVEVEDGVATIEGPADDHERDIARTLAGTVRGAVGVRFS